MKLDIKGFTAILLASVVYSPSMNAADALVESADDQISMVTSPRASIKAVTEPAFLKPEAYREAVKASFDKRVFSVGIGQLPQLIDESIDPRAAITAEEIEQYADKLVEFAVQSKDDGEILWGRIEGTKYESAAQEDRRFFPKSS